MHINNGEDEENVPASEYKGATEEDLWVDGRELTSLTLEENQEFANQKMMQLLGSGR